MSTLVSLREREAQGLLHRQEKALESEFVAGNHLEFVLPFEADHFDGDVVLIREQIGQIVVFPFRQEMHVLVEILLVDGEPCADVHLFQLVESWALVQGFQGFKGGGMRGVEELAEQIGIDLLVLATNPYQIIPARGVGAVVPAYGDLDDRFAVEILVSDLRGGKWLKLLAYPRSDLLQSLFPEFAF